MNRVEISGRLTRDPEIKYVGDARFPILSLNVAVDNGNGRFNRETRKTEYESGFYQVEVVGAYAERLLQHLNKGDEIYALGSLSQFTTQPKSEGESKTHTRIKAVVVTPLVGMPGGAAQGGFAPPAAPMTDDDPWATPGSDAGKF